MIDKQTVDALTAKIAAMSDSEREARVLELYELPRTPENLLEFMQIMLGGEITQGVSRDLSANLWLHFFGDFGLTNRHDAL